MTDSSDIAQHIIDGSHELCTDENIAIMATAGISCDSGFFARAITIAVNELHGLAPRTAVFSPELPSTV